MCGIAGILAPAGSPVDERALRAMTAALAARGPDGEAYHIAAPIGLGHRRLAVIDVAGGRQPLFSEDGRVAVIVNGEIYNFVALRETLEKAGHHFKTRADAEVLAHGYEEWGPGVLDRIEGMFALALWDARENRLLLARDRMGEKPLYFATLPGGGFAFSSELKSLRHAPGLAAAVDPVALAHYLVYEYVPAPAAIVRGVRKLEPGCKLTVRPGQAPVPAIYWDLPFPTDGQAAARPHDLEDAAAALLAELRRSVRERLVADVPLGVFLSGGIDSSTVAALAAEVRGGDLDTFSIGFDDPTFDESAEARRVARAIGSRHHEERLSARALTDLIPTLGRLLDEPLGDGSIVPTHLLARFARQKVTVALGGDGGDELFAGYPTFQAERVAGLLMRAPRPVGRAATALFGVAAAALPVSLSYFSFDFKLKQFLRGSGLEGARRHQAWLGSLAPPDALAALAPDLAREVRGDLYELIDQRLQRVRSADRWDRLMYFYAKGYLADQVLAKVDRATMAVGLEGRAPLLDSRVVALACQVAPALRMRGLRGKLLLKHALAGILPAHTLARKKQGFAMPIGRWLKGELRPWLEDQLSEARLRDGGLLEPTFVRRLVDQHLRGQADHRKPLWTLLAFQQWWSAWRASA